MTPKKIVILGSTGSIGINTLKIVERYKNIFNVVALSAYNNLELIENQVRKFKPSFVAVRKKDIAYFRNRISSSTRILAVEDDLEKLVSLKQVDLVVIAMRGAAALKPFIAALKSKKTVCPANKEALVIAGEILMKLSKEYKAPIIPIDSEQSAIFQCLDKEHLNKIHKIHLTASGGALLNVALKDFSKVTKERILNHPRWKMGEKITVDSATLMNKGFEVLEAMHLFNVRIDQINVVIHPEAIIHSMVEFVDGSVLAQLAVTDMRLPIQYALTYPKRLSTGLKPLNFFELKELNFQKPDLKKFPALQLAFYAGKKQGTAASVLNAADEEAVEAFLESKIKFVDIYPIVEKVVLKHKFSAKSDLRNILLADQWAREEAQRIIGEK